MRSGQKKERFGHFRLLFAFLLCLGMACEIEQPVVSLSIGAPCSDHSACQSNFCLGNLPDGYCSLRCENNISCPTGSVCTQGAAQAAFCLDSCESALGCREGYACRDNRCQLSCFSDSECQIGERCDANLGCVLIRESP